MWNIKIALRFEDKEYMLEKERFEIDETKFTPGQLAKYRRYCNDATKVACIMVATVIRELQWFYEDYWLYDMNKHLMEKYHQRDHQEKYEVVKSLITSKMKDKESVTSHFQRM